MATGSGISGEVFGLQFEGRRAPITECERTYRDWGSGQVHAYLRAFQTDGTIRYYTGTYTVQNGVIVAAHIVQD